MEKTKTHLELVEEGMDLFSSISFPSNVTEKQMFQTFVQRVYTEGQLEGMEQAKQLILTSQ